MPFPIFPGVNTESTKARVGDAVSRKCHEDCKSADIVIDCENKCVNDIMPCITDCNAKMDLTTTDMNKCWNKCVSSDYTLDLIVEN